MASKENKEQYIVKVTVYCLAFKHAKYIRETLEGFISQKTNFRFEVIIHDDASNDGTAEIIYEYSQRYPEIIVPIVQSENQYSKKISIVKDYVLPFVRGEYVAICEGDDYWTDSYKLQKQVDVLELHKDSCLCLHRVREVNEDAKPTGHTYPSFALKNEVIDTETFINMQTNYNFQTSSYMLRSLEWKNYIQNPPKFKKVSMVGDVPLLLYFGNLGPVCFIDATMSCYRRGVSTSFSMKLTNSTDEKKISQHQSTINMFELYDEYTDYRYHQFCIKKIAYEKVAIALIDGNIKYLLNKENKKYCKSLDTKRKIFIGLSFLFPHIMSKIIKIRRNKIKSSHAIN